MEHHPLDRHPRLQHLEHVPADRLTLAILVGRDDQLVGLLQRLLQLGDDLFLGRVYDVHDVEVVLGINAREAPVRLLHVVGHLFLAAGQIADVPDTRLHGEVATEIARDGLGLRG